MPANTMYAKMGKILVIAFTLSAVLHCGYSQGLDDMEEEGIQLEGFAGRLSLNNVKACVGSDDEFVEGLLGCFLTKFEDLIGGLGMDTLAAQDTYSARRLQSYKHMDDVMRTKVAIPRAMEQFQKTHKEFVNHMAVVGHVAKQKHKDQAIMNQLKALNMKTELRKYIAALARNIYPVKGRIALLAQQAMHVARSQAGAETVSPADDGTVELLCDFLPDLCPLLRMGQCLDNQPEEAFEDGLEWLYCIFECVDIPDISMCMVDLFNSTEECTRIHWLSDIIIRGFVEFVGLGDCAFKILSPQEEPIILREGETGTEVQFITYMPPGAMCFGPNMLESPLSTVVDIVALLFGFPRTCDVQIQVSTNMYLYEALPFINVEALGVSLRVGRPKCSTQDMTAINQVAVGFDEYSDHDASGVIRVDESNWNSTFRIPITAVVDHKLDGDVDLNFTLKYVVEGATHFTHKILMTALDSDAQEVSVCSSINDPHITTFDGHYYNNLYHGFYYMYKHDHLPYQVQTVHQACSADTQESCTCAVAVQSGDDVFVLDRCRRTAESCSGASCHPLRSILYTNGALTPNTRIIRRSGGLEYDVILPHGTVITIAASRDLLNVWVKPSTFDMHNTTGLCGLFNEDTTDDLLMPDGTIFSGAGSNLRGQPRPFNLAWRVPEEERIFGGAIPAPVAFEPLSFCRCTHVIFDGVTCECHGGHKVETCDIRLDGELMGDALDAIIRHSLRREDGSLGTKRGSMDLGEVDLDENYSPPELTWQPGMTEGMALAFCNNLLDNNMYENELIRQCRAEIGVAAFTFARHACVEDIQITNTTVWQFSALDAAKKTCSDKFLHTLDYDSSWFQRFSNSTCINECNKNGICELGKCLCNSGWKGADCLTLDTAEPSVAVDRSALCDRRHEECHFATVYGQNFPDDGSLICRVKEAMVSPSGVTVTGRNTQDVEVIFYSANQIACRLPTNTSYQVDVMWSGHSLVQSTQFYFLSFDSVCYSCDAETSSCSTLDNGEYCMIGGGCFDQLERDPANDCHVCNVTLNTDDWTEHPELRCEDIRVQAEEDHEAWRRDRQIRIGVACGLSGLVVLIVVIIFIVHKKREKARAKNPKPNPATLGEKEEAVYEEPNTNANNATMAGPSYDNAGLSVENNAYELEEAGCSSLRVEAMVAAAERSGSVKSGAAGTPRVQRERLISSSSGQGTPALMRVSRERTTSVSSVRSIGIGGGGPASFSVHGQREPSTGMMGGSLSPKSLSAGNPPAEDPIEYISRF